MYILLVNTPRHGIARYACRTMQPLKELLFREHMADPETDAQLFRIRKREPEFLWAAYGDPHSDAGHRAAFMGVSIFGQMEFID